MPNTPQRETINCRLITLDSGSDVLEYVKGMVEEGEGMVVINFPSMPDSIELARQAEYKVRTSFLMPDGIHVYKWTEPLIIPFSFGLHHSDAEYCGDEGPLALMKLAAKFESLVLPINNNAVAVSSTMAGPAYSPKKQQTNTPKTQPGIVASSTPGATGILGALNSSIVGSGSSPPIAPVGSTVNGSDDAIDDDAYSGDVEPTINPGNEESTLFPVTCLLDLIYSGPNSPGIVCVGYVKNVSAKLKGPWMNGGNGERNMPTSLECKFDFVHHPSHTNYFTSSNTSNVFQLGNQVSAFANDVRKMLYNTTAITKKTTGVSYRGFNG
jgi:hypothetical protein